MIESPFSEFENNIKRRDLLPMWIKVFCWIFMLFGVLAIVSLILGFMGSKADLAFYGFSTNEPLSLSGLLIISIGILKGYTAFSLWFEKDNAIEIGRIDAIFGIALCVISMIVMPILNEGISVTFRLELALLIPFLIKLDKIKEDWNSAS